MGTVDRQFTARAVCPESQTATNLYLVAATVDKRRPDGKLVAQNQKSVVNNWPLVGTDGHELPSLTAGLLIMCGQRSGVMTNVFSVTI